MIFHHSLHIKYFPGERRQSAGGGSSFLTGGGSFLQILSSSSNINVRPAVSHPLYILNIRHLECIENFSGVEKNVLFTSIWDEDSRNKIPPVILLCLWLHVGQQSMPMCSMGSNVTTSTWKPGGHCIISCLWQHVFCSQPPMITTNSLRISTSKATSHWSH